MRRTPTAVLAYTKLSQIKDINLLHCYLIGELDDCVGTYDMCRQVEQGVMRFFRTMIALLIALSVAMLPAAGSAASVVKSEPRAASEAMAKDMTMASDMSDVMDECCPDHANTKPCDQPNDQCPMAFCAVQLVNLASVDVFRFDFPITAATLLPLPADQVVSLHAGSPPFRPPRV
jgi:hypothetical protein